MGGIKRTPRMDSRRLNASALVLAIAASGCSAGSLHMIPAVARAAASGRHLSHVIVVIRIPSAATTRSMLRDTIRQKTSFRARTSTRPATAFVPTLNSQTSRYYSGSTSITIPDATNSQITLRVAITTASASVELKGAGR